jgi:hypothetical protein
MDLFSPVRINAHTMDYTIQTLARFGQTARDETDLAALQRELLRVVQETMQPETVSVWLKPWRDIRSTLNDR